MSVDLYAILAQIGRDKGIDKAILIEAVETAMLSAAKRHYGHHLNLEARFDEDSGEVDVLVYRTVDEKLIEPATQISLDEALSLDEESQVGDQLVERLETKELGRIAAQTAKHVIAQKLRDAERGVIYEEYKDSKGDIISGIVQRYDRGNVIANLGRTEAILPRREQIHRERYRQGDRIRGMILDIDPTTRGPQIILTRSHPDFLAKLFESEVEEISNGVVEIKGVAREPGERAKLAVYSNDESVDPVGACVGVKGNRVLSVVQELRGEKIDIVTWTSDEPSYVARALAPAEVVRVVVDEDTKSMEVVVSDDQLSLAIGRRGQNVRLASKLTGWKLDVRSLSSADEESKKARVSLESIPQIGFTEVELLYQEGFRSAQEVAKASVEDLSSIEGLDAERADQLIGSALLVKDEVQLTSEEAQADNSNDDSEITDIHRLVIDPILRDRLVESGFQTIQELVEVTDDDLVATHSLSEIEAEAVRSALDNFLKSSQSKNL